MMACQDMQDRLIDYHKGELTPAEEAEVKAHLPGCPVCASELERVRGIFFRLREELVPVEISAHVRAALQERIRVEATEGTAADESGDASPLTLAPLRPPTMRHSERHLRDMRKPLTLKMWEHARRSPYFAASILLHAAAAVVVVALLVQLHTKPTTLPASADVREPILEERIYEYVIAPEGQHAVFSAAYHQRRDRPHVVTRAVGEGDWVNVDVSQFAGRATLVAVPDLYFGMIRMYFADEEGHPDSAALLRRFPQGTLCRVERNAVAIPAGLASSVFKDGAGVRIFDMEDRLELWNEERWLHLESIARLVQIHLRGGMACFLAPLRGRPVLGGNPGA